MTWWPLYSQSFRISNFYKQTFGNQLNEFLLLNNLYCLFVRCETKLCQLNRWQNWSRTQMGVSSRFNIKLRMERITWHGSMSLKLILKNIYNFLKRLRALPQIDSFIYKLHKLYKNDYHIWCPSIGFLVITFSATVYSRPSNKAPKAAITKVGMLMVTILNTNSKGYSRILKTDSFYKLYSNVVALRLRMK